MKLLNDFGDKNHPPLHFLLNFIITTYLSKLNTVCVIRQASDQFNNYGEITTPVILKTIHDENLTPSTIQCLIDNGCQGFLVYDSLAVQFFDGYHQVKDNCSQRLTNVFILILPSLIENFIIDNLVKHPLLNEIANFLIIQNSEQESYNLLTSDVNDQNASFIVLDTFYSNETFANNSNLFPDKLKNLAGRSLHLSIFNYQPYTVWKSVDNPEESNAFEIHTNRTKYLFVDGTETIMMLEFCKKFNCVWEVLTVDDTEWGVIFDNGTGNGIVGMVVENMVDIGVGALYLWYHEYQFLGFTKPISRTGITCLVMKPKIKTGWLLPLFPFELNLWFAVVGSMVVGIVSLRLIQRFISTREHDTLVKTILIVFQIYLLQSVKISVKNLAYVILIGCILLIGLMMGNAYAGGLASVMTAPQYESSIHTVKELAESDLEWAATHDAWIFSIQLATQPMMKTILKKFRTFPKEVLADRIKQQNLAFSIERLPYGHYAVGEYITVEALENYQIMEEDIYWEGCVAMTSKTWPLLPKFDELVLRVIESGIQKYWELNVVMRYSNKNIQLGVEASKSQRHEATQPVRLQISHLMGVFNFLGIGLICSFFVFLGELSNHKMGKRAMKIFKATRKPHKHVR